MVEHYFSEEQKSEFRLSKISAVLRGVELVFFTAGGVFSPKKVDNGTTLLVNKCIIKSDWSVLDLGCGYGVAGIVLKKKFPKLEVFLTDINKRAIKLARRNAKENNVKVEIKQGDSYAPVKDKKFNTIILNPPQTAGKKLCFKLIEQAKQHLKSQGLLQIVARHQKGGKEFEKFMLEVFGNVDAIAKKGGFRVYVSKNE